MRPIGPNGDGFFLHTHNLINPRAPKSATLGSGIVESYQFNSRLQPTRDTVAMPSITTFADHSYNYPTQNNGNVASVTDQLNSGRTQTFTYDALSRLLSANNPESGMISYLYDNDGNLLQKTSPAPNQTGSATQTISYCYDELHRVTGRAYGAQSCPLSSPVVGYTYDSGQNAKGKLTQMTDQAGTATYSYDILGRLATETRSIAGVSKSTSYTYDLGGTVKTLTYPSNRVVTFTPDSAGRLVSAVDGNGTNYVTSASYGPDSSLTGFLNGSGGPAAITNTFVYTNRLQLCRIAASSTGAVPTSCINSWGNMLDLSYDFHWGNGDNGNVYAITNYRDQTRNQTFTYDALNRLISAWSAANTGNYSWGENYQIDAWGNLQISPMNGKAHGGNFQLSGNVQNRPTGLSYDAAGNLLAYGSASYNYDQENRLLSAGGITYTYDGNGERVLKSQTSNGAPVKRYWSVAGNTLAEADGTGNITAEYVYFGAKRVARVDLPGNSVHYYVDNHLGSTSVVANAAAAIEEESDYYPFGTEAVIIGPGLNELKFAGNRRDGESGLDLMGRRYFSNVSGRFMQSDPFLPFNLKTEKLQGWIGNPQHWNRYAYALNNPLLYVDPSGLTETVYYFVNKNLTDEQKKFFNENKDKILGAIGKKLNEAGIKDVVFKDGSSLSKSQISSLIHDHPTGVAFLNFANKSFGGHEASPGELGGHADIRSVVFLGNLQKGNPGSGDLIFRASEVGSHELGHDMGFYSRGEVKSFLMFWNSDLMNEGQGMPSSPRHFDMSIPQNQHAVDEINRTPEYGPCGVNDYRPPQ